MLRLDPNNSSLPQNYLNSCLEGYCIDFIQVQRNSDNLLEGEANIHFLQPYDCYVLSCNFVNNKTIGKAYLNNKNGILLCQCMFQNGIIEGECIIYDTGKIIFQGNMSSDGFGENSVDSVLKSKGYYRECKQHGICYEYDEFGNIIHRSIYKEGVLQEETFVDIKVDNREICAMKKCYENTTIPCFVGEINPKTLEFCGLYCSFDKEGNSVKLVEFLEDNMQVELKTFENGIMCEYDHNHSLQYQGEYKMVNELVYVRNGKGKVFNPDGKQVFEGSFFNGSRSGHGIEYEDGICVYDGEWQHDLRHGIGSSFNKNGTREWDGEWESGNFIHSISRENSKESLLVRRSGRLPEPLNDYKRSQLMGESSNNYDIEYKEERFLKEK